MKKKFILFSLIIISLKVFSQTDTTILLNKITQDAAASKTGQSNDILTNFYQLSLKNIFGKNGEISFTSTVFGIFDSLNKKIEVDTVYRKLRWARNITLNVAGKLDSSDNRIASFGGGLTFSLINKRDITKYDSKLQPILKIMEIAEGTALMAAKLRILSRFQDNASQKRRGDEIDATINKFCETHKIKDIDKELQSTIDTLYGSAKAIFVQPNVVYNQWKNRISERPLLTFGGNANYKPLDKVDTFTLKSDFLFGFYSGKDTNYEKPWEFNLSGSWGTKQSDTTTSIQHLHIESGFNKVLTLDEDKNSAMEFKLFAAFDRDLKGTLKNYSIITANFTYRLRVLKSFWIPLTISYDPKRGNIFGFINLTANIDKYNKK